MKKIVQRAEDRGYADHGWLKAHHSFSFANYHDPAKVHFGLLRVFNDDTIAPGMGFGLHPHDNMEIVTIPLQGGVRHKDSMGNEGVVKAGEVQVMSAGKGIYHSEHNASADEFLKLFQIWVFPKQRNITPRYDQKAFSANDRKGKFQTLVSPDSADGSLSLNQNVWFSLGDFSAGKTETYNLHARENGAYIMVVKGEASIGGETLKERDAIGIWETESVNITVNKDTELLVIDVPMD